MKICKKKLLISAKEWVTERRKESSWDFGIDNVATGAGSSAFSAWWHMKTNHILPEVGGWLSQPLAFLAEIEAIDLVVSTYQFISTKEADWTKLNATQRKIIAELGQ